MPEMIVAVSSEYFLPETIPIRKASHGPWWKRGMGWFYWVARNIPSFKDHHWPLRLKCLKFFQEFSCSFSSSRFFFMEDGTNGGFLEKQKAGKPFLAGKRYQGSNLRNGKNSWGCSLPGKKRSQMRIIRSLFVGVSFDSGSDFFGWWLGERGRKGRGKTARGKFRRRRG